MRHSIVYFAIIADRRSGSTMLNGTLNQHPEITCSGEIFNSYAAQDGWFSQETGYAGTMSVYQRWRKADHPPTTKAVGTLIHRWQAELFPGLMDLTRGLHSRFLCVHRENLLRHFISELVAMRTGKWTCDPATVKDLPRLHVEPEALRVFVSIRHRERAKDWEFQPRIDYSMERLTEEWDTASCKIQNYLRVEPIDLPMTTVQQETRTIKAIVTNYDEVVEAVTQLGSPEWLE